MSPASGAPRLLVVEDDARLRALLEEELGRAGYAVASASTLGEGLFLAEDRPFDLLILDRTLPDGDGLEIAERLRGEGDAAILMLTARSDVASRVEGLYAGAGDYLVKPFDLTELLARVHARLRDRAGDVRPRHDDLELDPAASLVRGPQGETVLPAREFALLRLLVEHPGRLFPRDEIERRLYAGEPSPGSNTVEVFVHHLRRKLDTVGVRPRIRTVRGKGYMLR